MQDDGVSVEVVDVGSNGNHKQNEDMIGNCGFCPE